MIARACNLIIAAMIVYLVVCSGWLENPHMNPGAIFCLFMALLFALDGLKKSRRRS